MNSLYIVSLLHMSPGYTIEDMPPVSEMAGTSTIKVVLCIERATYRILITSMYAGAHLPAPLIPLSPGSQDSRLQEHDNLLDVQHTQCTSANIHQNVSKTPEK